MWLFLLDSIPHSLHVEGEQIWRFAAGGLPCRIFLTQLTRDSRARQNAGFLRGFVTPSLGGGWKLKSHNALKYHMNKHQRRNKKLFSKMMHDCLKTSQDTSIPMKNLIFKQVFFLELLIWGFLTLQNHTFSFTLQNICRYLDGLFDVGTTGVVFGLVFLNSVTNAVLNLISV